jgi:hypothetical protein
MHGNGGESGVSCGGKGKRREERKKKKKKSPRIGGTGSCKYDG